MKEINSLKEIEKQRDDLKTGGIIFMIIMLLCGLLFHKYELGRVLTIMFGFFFIAYLTTMRYWCMKGYIKKEFNDLKREIKKSNKN